MKLKVDLKDFILKTHCNLGKSIASSKLVEIEDKLEEEIANKNTEKVKNFIGTMENTEGKFSQQGLWKIKRKLAPIEMDKPMAKFDKDMNLITAPDLLKQLYIGTYKARLSTRIMKSDLMDIYMLKNELWSSRLKNLIEKKSIPWNITNIDTALKFLKNNKTTDPHGMVNEVLKEGCIGTGLKQGLLMLLNGTKENLLVPDFMSYANITSIYKKKGSMYSLENDRGIFILTVIKKITDLLIYIDKYDDIDKNMSDSNVGARKKRNVKDHLLILHGVINSVINGNEECIDLQIYEIEKAFDALWLEDCLNDIIDNLPDEKQDDKIALLHKINEKNLVSIKTPHGLTERINIPNIVQQGGTWGPLLCSKSIDTIGKKCKLRSENYYLYKNTTRILPLEFIDDISGISKCGMESLTLNTFLTIQIELKKLRFHTTDESGKSKCHKLHIGKKNKDCPKLTVHGTPMMEVTEDTYLGDIITSDGKNTKNIKNRVSKGIGIISQIFNLMQLISF